MITACKSATLEGMLDRYARFLLRRHIGRIMVRGWGEDRAGLDREAPVILFANHSNWWDGVVAFFLSRRVLGLDAYTMMEERQLSRYRLFRRMGAFSVNRENARSALASIRYAAGLLDRPGRAVWMFPQGVMRPNDVRPLRFSGGIARLAQGVESVQLLPVALRYEFMMEQRPECFVAFGRAIASTASGAAKSALVADLEKRLTVVLDDLRGAVMDTRLEGFTQVLTGRASTNVAFDRARGGSEERR